MRDKSSRTPRRVAVHALLMGYRYSSPAAAADVWPRLEAQFMECAATTLASLKKLRAAAPAGADPEALALAAEMASRMAVDIADLADRIESILNPPTRSAT